LRGAQASGNLFVRREIGMPIFEYTCSKCGGRFELLVSASERDSVPCPNCKTRTLSREISAFAVSGTGKGGDSCGSCSTSSCFT